MMGWGTVSDAVSRQRYMARDMMARRARPRVRVKPGEHPELDDAPEFEPFDCFHLCAACGYLSDSEEQPCPGCGEKRWIDLRHVPTAEAVQQMEETERQTMPVGIQTAALAASIAAALGVGAALYLPATSASPGQTTSIFVGAAVLAVLTFLGLNWILGRLLVFTLLRRRPVYPIRWRLPVPLPEPGAAPKETLEGGVTPLGELIRAPVSGRECVGYEVSVLFDAPRDLRPRMWILEEERTAPFEVAGRRFEADGATIQLEAEPVDGGPDDVDGKVVKAFLRKRGLFAFEGEYWVFEALIEPGQQVCVALFGEPEGVAPVVRPATA